MEILYVHFEIFRSDASSAAAPLAFVAAISGQASIGLHLGIDLCEEYDCPCGFEVDRMGSHGLSCRRGPGRIPRHDAINDIVYRALLKAQIPSQKEPRGLTRDGSDKREDGCTLIPWQRGRSNDLGCHYP